MPVLYDKDFLLRYLNGKCSEKERIDFQQWLHDSEGRRDEVWLRAIWEEGSSSAVGREFLGAEDKILQSIQKEIRGGNSHNRKKFIFRSEKISKRGSGRRAFSRIHIIRYAAVILVLLLPIFLAKHFVGNDRKDAIETIAYRQKRTQAGQKLSFQLPDGTHVTLNASSTLEYPDSFSDTLRNVILHGEAFFEVAKDTYRPFHVVAGNLVTVALGTSFNIRSDSSEAETYISLTSGKVLVYNGQSEQHEFKVFLDPGEELAYNASNSTFRKKHFDYKENIAWKDGVLYFEEDNLGSIIRKIERWYGVSVHVTAQPADQWYFTGEFKDQSLENVLKGMAYSKDFKFSIDGKNVYLDFKKYE